MNRDEEAKRGRDALLADGEWGATFCEIEAIAGGRLCSATRQERWRPAWFCDLERDGGERFSVYYRGDRGVQDDGVLTLRREMEVLRTLAANGIPVSHVYGFCETKPGIVMETSPGRANLATAESDDERRAVLDDYLDRLADIHALDPGLFEKLGMPRPRTPEERSLADMPRWESLYRRCKNQPEPVIELVVGWLRANVPAHRERVSCLVGDSGQFLFERGRVTAILDVELATIGDPLADIGALLSRDLSEPLGDLSRGIARYRERTRDDFETRDVLYQAVRFAIFTPMATCWLCAAPPPGLNLVQYESWNLVYGRVPLQLIAQIEGVEIEAPELPAPRDHRHAIVLDTLVDQLAAPGGADAYRLDTARRIAEYVREIDRRGARLEEQDQDEAAALLGRRPASWREGDAEIERRAIAAGSAERPALLRFLVRRSLRREALLGAAIRELAGARAQRIDLPPLRPRNPA
jgi:aminoglycoside phosphotransferase (APT) family kinase protein